MKLNDIFKYEQYDEAYSFVEENPETTIIELDPVDGQRMFQIVLTPVVNTEDVVVIDE